MFKFITRLPKVMPLSHLCILKLQSCTCFVDFWHRYSRETYVDLNIQESSNYTILLHIPWAAKSPHKLEWWALRIVEASLLPARYHRPSSEARSSGPANLDPSDRDIFWPRFHPLSDAPYARGWVRGSARLSGCFTDMWRREWSRGERQTNNARSKNSGREN